MRTLSIIALFAASALGLSAATLTFSDFSNFAPGYFAGSWDENTFQSGPETFAVGNFGAGSAVNNGSFGVFIGTIDLTGYTQVTLTGFASAGSTANATEFLNFFVMDENLNTAIAQYTLTSFGTGSVPTAVSLLIDLSGIDPTKVTDWGFGTTISGADAFAFTFTKVEVSTSAIPEPSTYAALFGAAALTAALRRRQPAKAV